MGLHGRHAFVSPRPDNLTQEAAGYVTPSRWNAPFALDGFYDTRAEVLAREIPASVKAIVTGGRDAPGDGGLGIHKRMAAAPADPTLPGYTRSLDIFTSAGVEDVTHGGYWQLVPQGSTFYAEQFGIVADGVYGDPPTGTDNLPILLAAVRYMKALGFSDWAGRIVFGVGKYRYSGLIEPRARAHILGAGNVMNAEHGGATEFLFPGGSGGIQFNNDQQFGTSRNPAGGLGSAEGSLLEKVHLWSPDNGITDSGGTVLGDLTKHGVRLRTKATVRDVSVHGFTGDGFHVRASVGSGDPDEWGNANDWIIENPIVHVVGRHGVYVEGFDINGGKCDKLVTHGIRTEFGGCGIAAISGIGCCQFSNAQITGYGNKGVYHRTAAEIAVGALGGLYELISHTSGIGGATEPGTNNRIWYRVADAAGPQLVENAYPQWVSGGSGPNYIISRPVYNNGSGAPANLFVNIYVEGGGISHIEGGHAIGGNLGVTIYSNQQLMLGGGSLKTMLATSQAVGSFAFFAPSTTGRTNNGELAWVAMGTSAGGAADREKGIGIFEYRRLKDGDTSSYFGFDTGAGPDLYYFLNGGHYQGRKAWTITTPSTTATFGTVRAKSGVIQFDGFALADEWENENQARRFGISDGTPNRAYEHARGEVRFELNPQKGGHVGYSNTQTGINNAATWVSGTNYDRDQGGSFIVTGGRYYEITVDPGASITSTVEPVHTTPDGYGWTYIGTTLTDWRKFGRLDWDGSAVYDPPSLATLDETAVQTISMTGVQQGDFVQASFSNDLQGVILNAWCVGDAVKYLFFNPTGATVDLGSGTVRVRVARQ
jgi:hypothetical protein